MKKIICIILIPLCFLFACKDNTHTDTLLNHEAQLPPSFRFDSLGLKVIASFINKRSGTMATLYANPLALDRAKKKIVSYSSGEVLALVTWKERDDPYWFGAKIPGALQTVELVKINSVVTYMKYTGKDLLLDKDTIGNADRLKHILDLQPSIMP